MNELISEIVQDRRFPEQWRPPGLASMHPALRIYAATVHIQLEVRLDGLFHSRIQMSE